MKKIFSSIIILLITFGVYAKESTNDLDVIKGLKNFSVEINSFKIDETNSTKLIQEMLNAKKIGKRKIMCQFSINIENDGKLIQIKSDGGNYFSLSGDNYFEMNCKLIDFINLENISFIFNGEKYLIKPLEKNSVRIDSEFTTKEKKLSNSDYLILYSTGRLKPTSEELDKNPETFYAFYYTDNEKIVFRLTEKDCLFVTLKKLVSNL